MTPRAATQRRLIVHSAHRTVGVRVPTTVEAWPADDFSPDATDSLPQNDDQPPDETRDFPNPEP